MKLLSLNQLNPEISFQHDIFTSEMLNSSNPCPINDNLCTPEASPPHDTLNTEAWKAINTKFANINRDSWEWLKTKSEEPDSYIEELNNTLAFFLQSKQEFQHETKEYFRHYKTRADSRDVQ